MFRRACLPADRAYTFDGASYLETLTEPYILGYYSFSTTGTHRRYIQEFEMFEDRQSYAPLILFEYDHDPGNYCLMLSDGDMVQVMDTFEANGRYGNGYAWADVALQAMRSRAPELEARLDMDPEAGTFVAFGADLDALQRLGALIHEAFHDLTVLGPLVASAPYEWD